MEIFNGKMLEQINRPWTIKKNVMLLFVKKQQHTEEGYIIEFKKLGDKIYILSQYKQPEEI